MTRLLLVEMRRDLSRRLVWFLVGLGIAATLVAGALVAANSQPLDSQAWSASNTFRLTELWSPDDGGELVLVVPIVFLAIGGLLAGASTTGAEWRAGTMATLLTWEPRRVRVAIAKLLAAAVLAFLISVALLAFFTTAMAVVAATRGSTDGADGAWFRAMAAGVLRGGALASLTAVFGASVAMIGRNTAAALGVAFAYLVIGENVVRAWKPWTARWLFGENGAIFLTWRPLESVLFERGPGTAALTLVGYVVAVATAAVLLFRARDVASG